MWPKFVHPNSILPARVLPHLGNDLGGETSSKNVQPIACVNKVSTHLGNNSAVFWIRIQIWHSWQMQILVSNLKTPYYTSSKTSYESSDIRAFGKRSNKIQKTLCLNGQNYLRLPIISKVLNYPCFCTKYIFKHLSFASHLGKHSESSYMWQLLKKKAFQDRKEFQLQNHLLYLKAWWAPKKCLSSISG